MKRVIDIVIALTALILLSPMFVVIALAIWLGDFHAPLFRGIRVARGGGDFGMLKFRTMCAGAARTGVNSTAADDARITPAGRLLRRFKLDELPQLVNVLKGDMSLVGPRPQVRTDAGLYTGEERRMLLARPGITDLASIVFFDEGEILKGSDDPDLRYNQIIRPWKSRLALLYVDRGSILLDLRIVKLTALALVSRVRAIEGVERILAEWAVEPFLIRMASRREPLRAYAPPGAIEIVENYPARAARI